MCSLKLGVLLAHLPVTLPLSCLQLPPLHPQRSPHLLSLFALSRSRRSPPRPLGSGPCLSWLLFLNPSLFSLHRALACTTQCSGLRGHDCPAPQPALSLCGEPGTEGRGRALRSEEHTGQNAFWEQATLCQEETPSLSSRKAWADGGGGVGRREA